MQFALCWGELNTIRYRASEPVHQDIDQRNSKKMCGVTEKERQKDVTLNTLVGSSDRHSNDFPDSSLNPSWAFYQARKGFSAMVKAPRRKQKTAKAIPPPTKKLISIAAGMVLIWVKAMNPPCG